MDEINITELIHYYIKKLPIIIIVTLFTLLIGFFYIKNIQVPMYHGTTTIILVHSTNDKQSANNAQNEFNLNEKLVTTYSQIIKSRRVLDQVISLLNLDTTVKELANRITVTSVNETPIIKISVSDKDAKYAVDIANGIAGIFKNEITKIYNLENISIIDKAIVEEVPYNINTTKQLFIYGILGLAATCGIIFIIYYFDDTIKAKNEVEAKLNIAVLSEIPVATKLANNTKKKKNMKGE